MWCWHESYAGLSPFLCGQRMISSSSSSSYPIQVILGLLCNLFVACLRKIFSNRSVLSALCFHSIIPQQSLFCWEYMYIYISHRSLFTLIGFPHHIMSNTKSFCWYSSVCEGRLQNTSDQWSSPKGKGVTALDLNLLSFWRFPGSDTPQLVDGLSLLRRQTFGTNSLHSSVILSPSRPTSHSWRPIYLQQPSDITALENTQCWVIWALKNNYFDWLIDCLSLGFAHILNCHIWPLCFLQCETDM
jgi:hypothetical protein